MPVEFNKYKHPKDGSVVVMPNRADSVDTTHGVFKRIYDDGASNQTGITIVPAGATVRTGGVIEVQSPVSPKPSSVVLNPTPSVKPAKPAV